MFIEIDDKEHATILAALRLYQQNYYRIPHDVNTIATNAGKHAPLKPEALSTLCERINEPGEPTITIGLNIEGGNVQNVMTDSLGVLIDCIKVDWDTEGADDDELTPVPFPVVGGPEDARVVTETVEYSPEWMKCYREARAAADAAEQAVQS
jgi:hypothetical protein